MIADDCTSVRLPGNIPENVHGRTQKYMVLRDSSSYTARRILGPHIFRGPADIWDLIRGPLIWVTNSIHVVGLLVQNEGCA